MLARGATSRTANKHLMHHGFEDVALYLTALNHNASRDYCYTQWPITCFFTTRTSCISSCQSLLMKRCSFATTSTLLLRNSTHYPHSASHKNTPRGFHKIVSVMFSHYITEQLSLVKSSLICHQNPWASTIATLHHREWRVAP